MKCQILLKISPQREYHSPQNDFQKHAFCFVNLHSSFILVRCIIIVILLAEFPQHSPVTLSSCRLEISYLLKRNTSNRNPQPTDTLLTPSAAIYCIRMKASCMSNLIISHMLAHICGSLCKVPDHRGRIQQKKGGNCCLDSLFFFFLKERSTPSSYSFSRHQSQSRGFKEKCMKPSFEFERQCLRE